MVVLDASFIVKLVVREECTESALQELRLMTLRAEELHVPCTAVAEIVNAIWKHTVLLKDLSQDGARRALERLRRILRILTMHGIEELVGDALETALHYGITLYDALYIALAQRLDQLLYTYDRRLVDKIADENVRARIVIPECKSRS